VKTKTEIVAWLRSSPENVEELLSVAALWDVLPELSSQPSPEQLIALARADDNIVKLPGGHPVTTESKSGQNGNPRWFVGLAAAATLAAVVVGGSLYVVPPSADPNSFTTLIGEQSSLPLPDGSIMTLNTQSTVRISYSDKFRDIYLGRGEALFEVAKDRDRPFRVITDHAVVQAVGTQFNVYNNQGGVTVTVVEGIVDVQSLRNSVSGAVADSAVIGQSPFISDRVDRLTVGQQATVDAESGQIAVIETAIETATAWRQRRLVFEAMPLNDVIVEFNRYNDPPLVLDDPILEHLPISGVFRSNDRDSFVQFLSQMRIAESHTLNDGTIALRGIPQN
jgi:transmembrane sensor